MTHNSFNLALLDVEALSKSIDVLLLEVALIHEALKNT